MFLDAHWDFTLTKESSLLLKPHVNGHTLMGYDGLSIYFVIQRPMDLFNARRADSLTKQLKSVHQDNLLIGWYPIWLWQLDIKCCIAEQGKPGMEVQVEKSWAEYGRSWTRPGAWLGCHCEIPNSMFPIIFFSFYSACSWECCSLGHHTNPDRPPNSNVDGMIPLCAFYGFHRIKKYQGVRVLLLVQGTSDSSIRVDDVIRHVKFLQYMTSLLELDNRGWRDWVKQ